MAYQAIESCESYQYPQSAEVPMQNMNHVEGPKVEFPPGEIPMNYYQRDTNEQEYHYPREPPPTIVLGNDPAVVYCPTCKMPVHTRIQKSPAPFQYVLLVMTWLCLVFFAFLWLSCTCWYDHHHVCTRCRSYIGKKGDTVAIY